METQLHVPERAGRRSRLRAISRGLLHDAAYVLPGFLTSLMAFILLVTLFSVSVGTAIIWIGVPLLALTLHVAAGFARLDRWRLAAWQGVRAQQDPRCFELPGLSARGLRAFLSVLGRPECWFELMHCSVFAFPLRTLTFALGMTWIGGALGGLSFWMWGHFLRDDEAGLPGSLVMMGLHALGVPELLTQNYALASFVHLVTGVLFLLSLPIVMRGLAHLDAAVTEMMLGRGGLADPGRDHGRPTAPVAPSGGLGASFRAAGAPPAAEPFPATGAAVPASSAAGPPGMAPAELSGRAPGAADGMAGPAPAPVSPRAWAFIAMGIVGVILIPIAWPVYAVLYGIPSVLAMVLAGGQSLMLVLAARWPWPAIAGNAVLAIGTMALAAHDPQMIWPWPWPITALIAQLFLLLMLSMRFRWTVGAGSLALVLLPTIVAVVASPEATRADALTSGTVLLTLGAAVLAIGALLRLWLRSRGELDRQREVSEQEGARRRDLEVRATIARELHDVVAHSMSVISVQASTAQYRIEDLDEPVQQEFASIAEASRTSLQEMRQLLDLLRGTEAAPLAPQPSAADIPELVEVSRKSGTAIGCELKAETLEALGRIPMATGATAFRAVQEALSNALRHAPGAEITLAITVTEKAMLIMASNGPASAEGLDPAPGAGLGLAGLRERVAALGGTVQAGPEGDGGYRLAVALPVS